MREIKLENKKIDSKKLLEYGFKKEKNTYKYEKDILENKFRVEIEIKNNCIKKIDEFRSNINNGTFKKKSKRDNEKKVLYFERM